MDILAQINEDIRTGNPPSLDSRLSSRITTEGIPTIQHPLFYAPFYSPGMHRMYNFGFHQKLGAFKDALREGEWMRLVQLVERPFRIPVFDRYASRMSDRDYWRVLGFVYTDSENIDQFDDIMRDLLTSSRPQRGHLMDDDERAALAAMPDTITLYKGFSVGYDWDRDFSFTTSIRVAKWFARRYGESKPMLLEAEVEKKHVLAYFTGRNEDEILVDPDHVLATLIRPIPAAVELNTFGGGINRAINRLV